MKFRYFDAAGNPLTMEQLKSMHIVTPAMEHILATVADRVENTGKQAGALEEPPPGQYN